MSSSSSLGGGEQGQASVTFSTAKGGIAGIQRAAANKQRRHVTMTKEAFADLGVTKQANKTLGEQVGELIEKYDIYNIKLIERKIVTVARDPTE